MGSRNEMTMASITLQDLRQRLYVKAKAENLLRVPSAPPSRFRLEELE